IRMCRGAPNRRILRAMRQPLHLGFKIVQRQAKLLDLVLALRPASCFPGRLHGWEQEGDENTDDGNDDEQFDERKSRRANASSVESGEARGHAKSLPKEQDPMNYDIDWRGAPMARQPFGT